MNAMKTALENALAELRNQHREMIARTAFAPHGCPCVCGDGLETCPTLAVIEECERALADEELERYTTAQLLAEVNRRRMDK